MTEVNKQLEDQLGLSEQYKEELLSKFDEKSDYITTIQKEDMKLEIQMLEESMILKYKELEGSSKKEIAELKQQLVNIKGKCEINLSSLNEKMNDKTNKLKCLLYGVLATQILTIIMGIVFYFT